MYTPNTLIRILHLSKLFVYYIVVILVVRLHRRKQVLYILFYAHYIKNINNQFFIIYCR